MQFIIREPCYHRGFDAIFDEIQEGKSFDCALVAYITPKSLSPQVHAITNGIKKSNRIG